MPLSREISTFVEDILGSFGSVSIKPMFGGGGVYHDGVMFGLIADDVLYLKADDKTSPDFEQEGSTPFISASKNGKQANMPYWQVPERLYEDVDELAKWATKAYSVAKATKKRK